jgi:hypothetical protein
LPLAVRRWIRAGAILAVLGGAGSWMPVTSASAAPAPAWSSHRGAGGAATARIVESGYGLSLAAGTPWLNLEGGSAAASFRIPLAAQVGRAPWMRSARWSATTSGAQLIDWGRSGSGSPLLKVVVTAHPTYFTVQFSARVGTLLSQEPEFFTTGSTGLEMSQVSSGVTPDPVFRSPTRTPEVRLGPIPVAPYTAPMAPPPFVVELSTRVGWVGLGLVQVPDATTLSVTSEGAVAVNYPLSILLRFRDAGAGGVVTPPRAASGASLGGLWLQFPSFVITTSSSSRAGLVAYHSALAALGQAATAAPPGRRPSWWSWPLVDTWGQQLVTDAARRDDEFTASWVRRYVSLWKSEFHIQHFTVIIDSQWQSKLGSATPSSRFGGVAGMQKLVQELHSQGIKVLLWWPMWVVPSAPVSQVKVDPTSSSFASTLATQMRTLLGSGHRDLHVDGLKLDWGSLVPSAGHFSKPQLGVGAAALLRYMRLTAQDAWGVARGALIDASAMAPQFVRYEDLLRLYDANSAEAWSDRAATVSAVDPLSLMDGDGWRLTSSQAVSHIVGSSIFGTPAVYYASRWSGGAPITSAQAAALGLLISVAGTRGQGTATPLTSDPASGDDWSYTVAGRLAAQSLAGARAIVVYRYQGACRSPQGAEVVSMHSGHLTVPLPDGATLTKVTPSVPISAAAGTPPTLTVTAGVAYALRLLPGAC